MTWFGPLPIWLNLPRAERRSEIEIERDLEDEFAFHLEMKSRALVSEGCAPSAAPETARAQFGDVESIKRECLLIALKERIMLQRINFVMMLVVLIIVVGVGVQVFITQRYNTLALNAITAELVNMKYEALGAAREQSNPVYLEGAVVRAGTYTIPPGATLTLRRLVAAAGGFRPAGGEYHVSISATDDESGQPYMRHQIGKFDSRGDSDVSLEPNDHVRVEYLEPPREASVLRGEPALGIWETVGPHATEGWSLEIIGPSDLRFRPMSGQFETMGLLAKNGFNANLYFYTNYQLLVDVKLGANGRKSYRDCRWTMDGDQLLLNIAEVLPDVTEPLAFVYKTDAAGDTSSADPQAQSLGRFILRIFALADPDDPAPHETMRRFLAQLEDEVARDETLSASTRAMMQELLAARRKILEYDEEVAAKLLAVGDAGPGDSGWQARTALSAQARNQALQSFLTSLLVQADPQQEGAVLNVRDLLERAEAKVPESFADNPELAAQLRETIRRAREGTGPN